MQLDKVKEIIDLMTANGLAEFEMEENGVRLSIKKGGAVQVVQTVAALAPPASKVGPLAGPAPAAPVADDPRMAFIKAPFVGTLYRAPAPDAEPYVTVGQEVSPDTVLCIVEAMKVMNEIKAETSGVIARILVEDGKPVQYGQPLFELK